MERAADGQGHSYPATDDSRDFTPWNSLPGRSPEADSGGASTALTLATAYCSHVALPSLRQAKPWGPKRLDGVIPR